MGGCRLRSLPDELCHEEIICVAFQRQRPVRSCCAPSKKRWVSPAGQHFGPGGKFTLHRRLGRTLDLLNTKNKHASNSMGWGWGGYNWVVCCVLVYREFNRENMEAALIICSAAPCSYLHYLVLLTQPAGELTLTQSVPSVGLKLEL